MDSIELTCENCGTRYKLLRRPPVNKLTCKKCGAVIEVNLPPPERVDRTGQSIGGYTILKRLSEGERTDVYRAEQLAMHRMVALKMLGDAHAADNAAVDEFTGTARLVAGMHHPSIVSIYDVNAADVPYFSMEYVEGSTVREMLDNMGLPSRRDALRVAVAVGTALAHALRSGAEGLRITPDTVMVTSKGEVKITSSAFSAAADTREAPESRAIVALGTFLYALLTGIEPDAGPGKIDPPSRHNPDVSEALDRAVLRMRKGQKKGFSSIVAATQSIRHLLEKRRSIGHTAKERFGRTQKRRPARSPATLITAVALCVACVGVLAAAAWYLMRQQDINSRLNRIRMYIDRDNHVGLVEAGEEFIRDYPTHSEAGEIERYVEASKEIIRARKLKEEAHKAVENVLAGAVSAPHLVKTYHDKLDEIAETFSDAEDIDRLVASSKRGIEQLWDSRRRLYEQEIKRAARKRKYAEAYETIKELESIYAQPGPPDPEKGAAYVQRLRNELDRILNNRFLHITNNLAFNLEQEGKIDEAIKIYQEVIDTWGVEEYASRARRRIDKLRARLPRE